MELWKQGELFWKKRCLPKNQYPVKANKSGQLVFLQFIQASCTHYFLHSKVKSTVKFEFSAMSDFKRACYMHSDAEGKEYTTHHQEK
jgi:hypothetical protein